MGHTLVSLTTMCSNKWSLLVYYYYVLLYYVLTSNKIKISVRHNVLILRSHSCGTWPG